MDNKRYDAYGNEVIVSKDDFNLTQKDKKIYDKKFETKATTYGKDALKRFSKNKSSVVAAVIITLLLLLALIVPVVSPYDISTVHQSERLLPPKMNEPVDGEWKQNWNGTKFYTNIPYDEDTGLPKDPSYLKNAIVAIEAYPSEYVNAPTDKASNGTFILTTSKKAGSGYVYLSIYNLINYTSTDNYKIVVKVPEENLTLEEGFVTDMKATKFGQYRIIIEYGELDAKGEKYVDANTIVLQDWSTNTGTFELNISDEIEKAGLTKVNNGRITFQLKNEADNITYLPLQSVVLSSDTADENIKNQLAIMSMDNDIEELDDCNGKALLVKLNTGKFPVGFWRSDGVKTVFRAAYMKCNILYDVYEATYGIKETKEVTHMIMQQYMDKGWCKYNFEIGPSSFIKLSDKCPVERVVSQKSLEIEGLDGTTISYELTTETTMYKYYGYKTMPKYLLGTDNSGYDLITISFNGLRTSLLLAITVSAICLTFGLCWGAISGYFGGNVDLIMERFCDILGGVPWIVVMTLAILLLGNNIITFGLALCLTGWMGTAARTRTQFYRFKGREYILASRTLGSSDGRLIFRHILPNALGTIVTGSILSIPGVIFSEATLSYLNLGLQGSNSFGNILSRNQQYLDDYPALIVFPAIVIALIMISFNLFGNGLRDALNPSLKGSE